jgi:hypothetical protein
MESALKGLSWSMEHAISDPKVARAIRRSRAVRAARKSRKRKRIIAATCSALLLGGALSFSLSGLTAADAVYASVQKAKSLADLLAQRSPGERTEAQLTKHKRAGALARHRIPAPKLGTPPSAMELAKILLPPAVGAPVPAANPASVLQTPPVTLAQIVGPGGAIFVSPPGGGTPGGGITPGGETPPGGGTPPGGETPPGGNPPIVTPPTSPELVPAVPEPGTWAMMLMGFGFIGWRVRREQPAPPLLTA